MKISPISYIPNVKQLNFKGTIPPENKQDNSKANEKSALNPLYYQAFYSVNFLMPVIILGKYNNNDDDFYIQVENDFTNEFLTNGQGQIDKEKVDKFLEIYQKIANEFNELRLERLEIYKNEKEEGIPIFEDNKKGQDDFLDGLINCQELEITNVPFDAYEKAKRFFQLSKTQDGIDISDYDKKMKLIGDIEMYTLNIFEPHNEDVVYNQIIRYAKDDRGNLDYDLINDVFDAIDGQGCTISAKKVITVLKTLYSKDEKSKKEILDTVKKLNNTYFDINSSGNSFIRVMNLCFDNSSKFSSQRASFVIECCDYLATFIDTALSGLPFREYGVDGYPVSDDDEDAQYNNYEYIVNTAHNILISYFDEITDADGELHNDELTIEDYIRTII